jgi:hypothetical protein
MPDPAVASDTSTAERSGCGREKAFGAFPVPICHEWNTIAHLNDYKGNPGVPSDSTWPGGTLRDV